jgi:hypothetical protein
VSVVLGPPFVCWSLFGFAFLPLMEAVEHEMKGSVNCHWRVWVDRKKSLTSLSFSPLIWRRSLLRRFGESMAAVCEALPEIGPKD